MEILEKGTITEPGSAEVWLALSEACIAVSNYERAFTCAEKAAILDPDRPEPRLISGKIALEAGQLPVARLHAEAVLLRDPGEPAALLILAKARAAEGSLQGALNFIENSIPAARDAYPLLIERVALLKKLGAVDEAIKALQELSAAYPREAVVLKDLAEMLAASGNKNDAEAAAQAALRLQPYQPDLHLLAGSLQRETGQLDQAVYHLSEAVHQNPGFVDGYLELGKTYMERRETAMAIEILQQAIAVAPQDARPYFQSALVLKDTKDYVGAEKMLRKAASLDPDDVTIRRQLGALIALESGTQSFGGSEISMATTMIPPHDFQRPVSRPTMLALLKAGLKNREFRFTRQAALSWLASFPGDILVNYLLAQAMLEEGRVAQVLTILDDVCSRDPEFLPAQKLLSSPRLALDKQKKTISYSNVAALGGRMPGDIPVPVWSLQLRQAHQAYVEGKLAETEQLVSQALSANSTNPLPALLHMAMVRKTDDMQAVHNLANIYHSRWPENLAFSLYLAEARLHIGDEAGSVALLHQCVAHDAAGQVAERIWGKEHPYKSLWPEELHIYFDQPIPAAVSRELGWNMLGGSGPVMPSAPDADYNFAASAYSSSPVMPVMETSMPISAAGHVTPKGGPRYESHSILPPDMLQNIQEEFERIARRLRLPGIGRADARFPVYVVCSSRQGLLNQYGSQTSAAIDAEMKKLAEQVSQRPNWGAIVFYPDDPDGMASLGMQAAPFNDAWKLKLAIAELDKVLARKGEMIGALMIIGGPEVFPFHRLPNPTDDFDAEVPSDNPYASRDENYFVPEWPIGRLPGGNGPDAGLLLAALRQITAKHADYIKPTPWWQNYSFLRTTSKVAKAIFKPHSGENRKPSFGFTAAVWKQSSLAVFKPIGESRSMLVSPPVKSNGSGTSVLKPSFLSYFNLHGLPNSADWYGQREVGDNSGSPDYPVAVSPKDVLNHGQAPSMVYSEACYGANIAGKSEDDALSLKFLASGVSAMVGSTCISYGSVTTPLIAADLLGYLFWKHLRQGIPAGESLQKAKNELVREMNSRQGYLDGEDQKTLVSFVLLGDPLATLTEFPADEKTFLRPHSHPTVKTVCDRPDNNNEDQPITLDTMTSVKKIVDRYLPGLQNADFKVTHPHTFCTGVDHNCPTAHFATRGRQSKDPDRTVVTLSKQVQAATYTHRHYARVTLDRYGKMVKLSISR